MRSGGVTAASGAAAARGAPAAGGRAGLGVLVSGLVEGETRRFWIPEKLAYQGKQPPFGMLVFDVELIKIQ